MDTANNIKTIRIYKSHSMADACKYVMDTVNDRVDQTNLSISRTIIVPDHMSLEAERTLLNALDEKGSFNTQIKTFQRLANDVLPTYQRLTRDENAPEPKYLSKQAGIMALAMIIKEIKKKGDDEKKKGNSEEGLKCYVAGVDTPGFVENMYDVISMLRYCKIEPEKLMQSDVPDGVKAKARDIAKIYQAYRDYTKEHLFTDSADKLDNLREAIANIGTEKNGKRVEIDVVSNGYFYFYDFDNLTKQELEIIKQLALKSMGVTVACCVGEGKRDSYLYLNDIYEGVKGICDESKGDIEYSEIEGPRKYSSERKFAKYAEAIGHNLYRYDAKIPTPYSDLVEIYAGETRVDEVYALACKIKKYISEGGRYRDVYVVTSDVAKYSNAVSIIFNQFDIPAFCDRQFVLSDHPYARFVLDYLTMCKNGAKLQFALPVVKNYLFCGNFDGKTNPDDVYQFENFCLKYNIKRVGDSFEFGQKDEAFPQAYAFCQKFRDLYKPLPNSATVNDYVEAVCDLIERANLNEHNNKFAEEQSDRAKEESKKGKKQTDIGFEYASKVTAQAQTKFEGVLKQASDVMGASKVTLDEFIKMLTAGVASVKMSVIPVRNDCVVFANMSKARKHDIKFLALLGANQGAMPIVKSDCKLLSDKNIEDLKQANINIEPKIAIENKRERFSLFQLLLEPSDKLYVSYPKTDGASTLFPSSFIAELGQIFVNMQSVPVKDEKTGKTNYVTEAFPLLPTQKVDEGLYTMDQTVQKLVQNYRRAQENRIVTMPEYQYKYFLHEFRNEVDSYVFAKDVDVKVERGTELYLKHAHTSISQLTAFFECPYKFYFRYGLNVKPRTVAEFQSSDIGTILHAVLEKYVPMIDKDADNKIVETDVDTEKKARACFDAVLKQDYRSLSGDAQMQGIKGQIEDEAVRMCKVVKSYLSQSEFETFATELCFGENSTRQEDEDTNNAKLVLPPLKVKFSGGEFNLKGVIDRVDVLKSTKKDEPNKFLIVDYKSGKEASNFNETYLYVGQKMQLLVYAKAVETYLQLDSGNGAMQPVGFYYFRMHDSFTDLSKSDSKYIYRGRTINDLETICQIDTDVERQIAADKEYRRYKNADPKGTPPVDKPPLKSAKLGLRLTAPNDTRPDYGIHGQDANGKTLIVNSSVNQFDNEMEYAMRLIARAGELMTEGYAAINPYEGKCDICDYRSICDFGDLYTDKPRKQSSVSKDTIDNTVKPHE